MNRSSPSARPRASLNRPAARPTTRSAPTGTGPSGAVRRLVAVRDELTCVRCGARVECNDHHRIGRGSGGAHGEASGRINLPSNLLSLCGSGTTGCHGLVTDPHAFGSTLQQVREHGYVLRRNAVNVDPALVPVLTWRGWELFDDTGGRTPCDPPDYNPLEPL